MRPVTTFGKLLIAILVTSILIMPLAKVAEAQSAGLLWGPFYVGNLRLYMTNPHWGYAGPKVGNANHVNFLVDKRQGHAFVHVANYPITKYRRGESVCAYVWESHTRTTVFDSCTDDWTNTAQQAADAIYNFTRTLLDYGNWVVWAAVTGIVIIVIIDAIVPGDPIPVLPFGGEGLSHSYDSIPLNVNEMTNESIVH